MVRSSGKDFDVAMIGGGVAGLTAALQLKELRPATRIAVFEKRSWPVTPSAYKVGESTSDVAGHYFGNVIGLRSYLESDHLRKMGLRWFCSDGRNDDITRRIEIGLRRLSPLATFHIDRGRMENDLATMASDRGIDVRDGSPVADVELGADRHTLTVGTGPARSEVRARWVVDATGRQALLRHRLGLGVDLPIQTMSSWFRTPYRLMVDEWSDDPAWRAQVPTGTRWRSTVGFVGEGYWTWIINLGSGAASIGVVADPRFVPWERIRRYDALLDWLREVEPQLAEHLPEDEHRLLDFMKRKDFSHSCKRAYARARWALVGEAAVLIDPLYSTGYDTTAIGNTLLTDLIARELDGEGGTDLSRRVRSHNRTLLGTVQGMLDFFPEALAIYGRPEPTAAKLVWDNISYFTMLVTMFYSGAIAEPDLMRTLRPSLAAHAEMNAFMQRQFRAWARSDADFSGAGIPNMSDFLFEHMVTTPLNPPSHRELLAHSQASLARLQAVAEEITSRMCEAGGVPAPEVPPVTPGRADEELVTWSDHARRSRPIAEQEPQPEEAWLIR